MDTRLSPSLPIKSLGIRLGMSHLLGGLMCGIKIPQQDFALKMQGGGGLMREGGRICGTLQ